MDGAQAKVVRTRHLFPKEILNEYVNIIQLAVELNQNFPDSEPSVSKQGGTGDIVVEIEKSIKYDDLKPFIMSHSVPADETPEAKSEREAQKQANFESVIESIKADSDALDALSRIKELEARVAALEGKK